MPIRSNITGAALRNLVRRRVRALATALGVALCVALALAAVALASGLRELYAERLVEVGAHVTVTAADARGHRSEMLLDIGSKTGAVALGATAKRDDRIRIRNVMALVRSIEHQLGDRARAVSPFVAAQVLATHGTRETELSVKGVLPEREDRLAHLSRSMLDGSVARLQVTRFGVLLGEQAARELNAFVGDRIRFVSMTGEVFNVAVVGIYDLGVKEFDRGAIMNLRFAQSIARALPSEASAIGIQLRDPDDAPRVADRLERSGGRAVVTWKQANPVSLSTLELLEMVLVLFATIALLIASLIVGHSILASIGFNAAEAVRMRSNGTTQRQVTATFAVQGIALSAAGCFLGCVAGLAAIRVMATTSSQVAASLLAIESATLPVRLTAPVLGAIAIGAVLSGAVSSWIAARASSRIGGSAQALPGRGSEASVG